MRTATVFLALGISMAACTSIKPADIVTDAVIDKSVETTWDDLTPLLLNYGFVIKESNIEAGMLIAHGEQVVGENKKEWLDCGFTPLSYQVAGGYNRSQDESITPILHVKIRSASEGQSDVQLNLKARVLPRRFSIHTGRSDFASDSQAYMAVDCYSREVLEGELIAALDVESPGR